MASGLGAAPEPSTLQAESNREPLFDGLVSHSPNAVRMTVSMALSSSQEKVQGGSEPSLHIQGHRSMMLLHCKSPVKTHRLGAHIAAGGVGFGQFMRPGDAAREWHCG